MVASMNERTAAIEAAEIDSKEAWAILDRKARRLLSISAVEFVEKYKRGEYSPDERPGLMSLVALLPTVDECVANDANKRSA
jgi:hypothetical protein